MHICSGGIYSLVLLNIKDGERDGIVWHIQKSHHVFKGCGTEAAQDPAVSRCNGRWKGQ